MTVFWDTSAFLPLIVQQQPFTAQARKVAGDSTHRVIAFIAELEASAALERLHRDGTIATRGTLTRARGGLGQLLKGFDVVPFQTKLMEDAVRMVERHPLRTLDAIQLASCRVLLTAFSSAELLFVTSDSRLATAAREELPQGRLLGSAG